ncbi:MAG: hypothetical protein ACTS5I_17850, partial [Rhodanobacter sp.]
LATQRILDKKRDTAATTEHKSSAVDHQNRFLAKAVAFVSAGSFKPTEIMTEGAEQTVNLAMALAGTGLPALALFIAGLYRRRDERPSSPSTALQTVGTTNTVVIRDEILRLWAEKNAHLLPQLKAA